MQSNGSAQLIGVKPGARVRIVDLAEHLNLTKSTVSRALNGYPDISETTRNRVCKAAERFGYRPLSHAQAIKTGRVRSIGLVLQMNEHDTYRPFMADFLAGLSEAASREDWTMTVTTASSDKDTLRLLNHLSSEKKVDGFILPRTRLYDPRIDFLREQHIPFVLYGRTANTQGCAWFDVESEVAIEDAVTRLAALGHKKIGFIPGMQGYTYTKLRLQGYLNGLQASGMPATSEFISAPAVDREGGRKATHDLLAKYPDVTAMVCSLDRAALGVYDAARELDLQIGKDLSVISYDGIPESTLLNPPLSTFSVDTRNAGARLADALIQRCRGTAPDALRALAPAKFLDRASHGPAPS